MTRRWPASVALVSASVAAVSVAGCAGLVGLDPKTKRGHRTIVQAGRRFHPVERQVLRRDDGVFRVQIVVALYIFGRVTAGDHAVGVQGRGDPYVDAVGLAGDVQHAQETPAVQLEHRARPEVAGTAAHDKPKDSRTAQGFGGPSLGHLLRSFLVAHRGHGGGDFVDPVARFGHAVVVHLHG